MPFNVEAAKTNLRALIADYQTIIRVPGVAFPIAATAQEGGDNRVVVEPGFTLDPKLTLTAVREDFLGAVPAVGDVIEVRISLEGVVPITYRYYEVESVSGTFGVNSQAIRLTLGSADV